MEKIELWHEEDGPMQGWHSQTNQADLITEERTRIIEGANVNVISKNRDV